MKFPLKTGFAVVLLSAATAGQVYAQNRFQGMDRDRDGVITRAEWRGSDQAFRNQDWNGDGVLSGEEVRPGAKKPQHVREAVRDWNNDGVVNEQDALIDQRFSAYDRNNDGRITEAEWRTGSADSGLFSRLDANHDRTLTMAEYASGDGFSADSQGGPRYMFTNVDRNHDGWITRNEWNMDDADFNRLDTNRDNRISQYEFQSYSSTNVQVNSRFTALDTNHDGLITWNEWRGTEGEYVRLDTNGDARINVSEFEGNPTGPNRFAALDANRDGWLTRDEWKWSDGSFYRMDTNSDNRLSRMEFQSGLANTTNHTQADEQYSERNNGQVYNPPAVQRTRAAQTGYDRGLSEGRQAGREDYANGHGWDLDGQTELERADSGYYPQLGTLGDYQGGYREGFRIGYREGFGQR